MLYTGQPQAIRQDSYVQDSYRSFMYRVTVFTIRRNLWKMFNGLCDWLVLSSVNPSNVEAASFSGTMQYDTTQTNTTQHDTNQHNTTQT